MADLEVYLQLIVLMQMSYMSVAYSEEEAHFARAIFSPGKIINLFSAFMFQRTWKLIFHLGPTPSLGTMPGIKFQCKWHFLGNPKVICSGCNYIGAAVFRGNVTQKLLQSIYFSKIRQLINIQNFSMQFLLVMLLLLFDSNLYCFASVLFLSLQ